MPENVKLSGLDGFTNRGRQAGQVQFLIRPIQTNASIKDLERFGINHALEALTTQAISHHSLPLSIASPVHQFRSRVGQGQADPAFQGFLPARKFRSLFLPFSVFADTSLGFTCERTLGGFENKCMSQGRRDAFDVFDAVLFLECVAGFGFHLGLKFLTFKKQMAVEPFAR